MRNDSARLAIFLGLADRRQDRKMLQNLRERCRVWQILDSLDHQLFVGHGINPPG
jgi:hypothetical protein